MIYKPGIALIGVNAVSMLILKRDMENLSAQKVYEQA